jgi:hypothetical protein
MLLFNSRTSLLVLWASGLWHHGLVGGCWCASTKGRWMKDKAVCALSQPWELGFTKHFVGKGRKLDVPQGQGGLWSCEGWGNRTSYQEQFCTSTWYEYPSILDKRMVSFAVSSAAFPQFVFGLEVCECLNTNCRNNAANETVRLSRRLKTFIPSACTGCLVYFFFFCCNFGEISICFLFCLMNVLFFKRN